MQDFTGMQITEVLLDVRGLAKYMRDSDVERREHQAEIQEHLQQLYEIGEVTLAVTQ